MMDGTHRISVHKRERPMVDCATSVLAAAPWTNQGAAKYSAYSEPTGHLEGGGVNGLPRLRLGGRPIRLPWPVNPRAGSNHWWWFLPQEPRLAEREVPTLPAPCG